jgi:hypothetical protein
VRKFCEKQYWDRPNTLPANTVTVTTTKLMVTKSIKQSRDSSVGTALGYGLDDRGSRVRFPAEAANFSLHDGVQNGSGAHPAPIRGALCLGVKRPGREADHSPPSNAQLKE